ncbi:DUF2690 domain-containing protein [Streptomyces sp. NPDC047000]|uniref:helix-turn-helix domain-containing protein n=1 Tax=Streptomyces sp. NPDC047000 TaxID=3155474 RepID=UPI0033CE4E4F
MPRWRALPDDLDPQVKEFAEQLRRLVDRSGLGVAALADHTGYSKTSWERYLNGRLLAPKGAVVALAEVTGTSPVHLTTLWELAERAWSRSEMRHDMTVEAIRISTARAASAGTGTVASPAPAHTGGRPSAPPPSPAPARPGVTEQAGTRPAGSGPAVPRSAPPEDAVPGKATSGASGGNGGDGTANSWGVSGYRGPSRSGGRPAPGTAAASGGTARPGPATPDAETPFGPQGEPPRARAPRPAGPAGGPGSPGRSRGPGGSGAAGGSGGLGGPVGGRRLVMFAAGLVGVLVVVAVALFLTRDDGGNGEAAHPKAKPSATATRKLPPGVKCAGTGCTGKDAEAMGCAKDTTTVSTVKSATVGTTLVEVRYSTVCGAAWGRITSAAPGDRVTLTAGTKKVSDGITTAGDTIAYTPMVAAKDGSAAKACVTLASGQQGCTP